MGASGQQLLNFGAQPGNPEAEVDVTGQAGLVVASEIEAWVQPVATAEHSADEHTVESLKIIAFYKVDGTFTIRGREDSPPQFVKANHHPGLRPHGQDGVPSRNRLYGNFNIGWAWN